ncbi:MAG: outer membrane protein assembly factor BamE [Burkholderiaceae bacterium]|nr:outer membrane protein assembly factor BamE [Burkholderiaceae bacterium]
MHRLLLSLLAIASLPGCEALRPWTPAFVQPYRPDVQQGNVVTQEMVEQLQEGMTRDQVRFLLGTPLLTSIFHRDRWDYVYYLQRGKGSERQMRRLTVHFENDRLRRVESDPMPPEKLADNLILGRKPKAAPQPPPKGPDPQVTIPAR